MKYQKLLSQANLSGRLKNKRALPLWSAPLEIGCVLSGLCLFHTPRRGCQHRSQWESLRRALVGATIPWALRVCRKVSHIPLRFSRRAFEGCCWLSFPCTGQQLQAWSKRLSCECQSPAQIPACISPPPGLGDGFL